MFYNTLFNLIPNIFLNTLSILSRSTWRDKSYIVRYFFLKKSLIFEGYWIWIFRIRPFFLQYWFDLSRIMDSDPDSDPTKNGSCRVWINIPTQCSYLDLPTYLPTGIGTEIADFFLYFVKLTVLPLIYWRISAGESYPWFPIPGHKWEKTL